MNSSCGFRSRVTLSPSNYIFVFTSVSLSDILFLSEMIGRFEKLFSTRADCVLDSNAPSLFVLSF